MTTPTERPDVLRRGLKLPPPTAAQHSIASLTNKANPQALLRTVRTRVGRALSCLLLSLPLLALAACDGEPAVPQTPMTRADSLAAGLLPATLQISIDTAWAGETHYDLDGNLILPISPDSTADASEFE